MKITSTSSSAENAALWLVTYNWLTLQNIKIDKDFCKEEISTHPDYPALTSVVDFLNAGSIDSFNAVQADISWIGQFNYPVLAHINADGDDYLKIISTPEQWKEETAIIARWSGITIYPEKNATWVNQESNDRVNQHRRNGIVAGIWAILGCALFIAAVFFIHQPLINVLGFLSLAGIVISCFTLGSELGFQNDFVKQVCGTVSKSGCEAVLKSSRSFKIAGFGPADFSILYFITQFTAYLAACFYPTLIFVIVLMALPGVVVSAWSIYIQKVKIGHWCALCIAVVSVLVFQFGLAVVTLFSADSFPIASNLFYGFLFFASVFILAAAMLIPLKNMLEINKSLKHKEAELKKWKSDAELFLVQLNGEESAEELVFDKDLLLGAPDAPVNVTVACNPYCGPCARAHKELDQLLHKFKGAINVRVRFLCNPANMDDQRTKAVYAIFQQAFCMNDPEETGMMLNDWFELMDLQKWMNVAGRKSSTANSDAIIARMWQHRNWANESNVMYTPTFFVNGHRMPGRYLLKDLERLIPSLAEKLTESKQSAA